MKLWVLIVILISVRSDLLSKYSSIGEHGKNENIQERIRISGNFSDNHPGEWILTLNEGTNPEDLAHKHGLIYKGHIRGLPKFHLFVTETRSRDVTSRATNGFIDDSDVVSFEIQHQKRRFKRGLVVMQLVRDPLYYNQWHLHGDSLVDVDVETAWHDRSGEGIVVAIVDDGLEWDHPDIIKNYREDLSIDLNDGDNDPSPFAEDGHGTSAAGLCCAASNKVCGMGVAPESDVVGIRLIAGPVADYQEALALSHESDKVHIYSSSWGPYDDGSSFEGPGPVTREMFRVQADLGRNGLGSIWVWAGGNGRENGDNCNYDGYANNRFTIAVGALAHDGNQAWYSESCASLFVVSPSSGVYGYGIITTDLTGRKGYAWDECTDVFGGTSAAAPMVAGAVALLLEDRSDLTWRDVQHILAKSAIMTNPGDNDWITNSRGYKHNHKFGFGKICTSNIIRVGREHQLVPPIQKSCTSGKINLMKFIGKGGFWTWQPVSMPSYHCNTGSDITFVEHVELALYIEHPRRGQIEIVLESPENVKSVLAEVRDDVNYNYPSHGWTFTSVRHWGEHMTGEWNIGMRDASSTLNHKGKLRWFELTIYGY